MCGGSGENGPFRSLAFPGCKANSLLEENALPSSSNNSKWKLTGYEERSLTMWGIVHFELPHGALRD